VDTRIYLDHAATTPLDPRVFEAMLPCLTQTWANPSSIYAEAREARLRLTSARRMVAEILGARPAEIIFTSGGSESDNLALRGISRAMAESGNQIVTVATEHHAVLHAAAALESGGSRVTVLPVNAEGFVDPLTLENAVGPETILVSVMLANNETGTIQRVAELSALAKRKNPRVIVHTDAVQAAGMLPIDVNALGVDALSLAAHKFYGPKGTGLLYLRAGTPLDAQIAGGSQENERRAGTENVAGAVGLAAALRLATDELALRSAHARRLRDRLLDELPKRVSGTIVTGPREGNRRIATNASFCFEGVDAELLLMQLDLAGVSASSGSACTSGSLEPSHVLTAMGVAPDLARSSLRLTLGTGNTAEEIETLLTIVPELIERQRSAAAGRTIPSVNPVLS
jgi:cysteine desulfurase